MSPVYRLWRRFRRLHKVRQFFYDMVGRTTRREAEWRLMNFGFAFPEGETPPPMSPEAEAERFGLQMYHRVASGETLGGNPLEGSRVLEIGCGRGGGARYVLKNFAPASVLAVDFAPELIKFCQAGDADERLEFRVGNAMSLDLPDAQFDQVINVESSHCYADKPAFWREVRRVLKPGATFHYADDFARKSWERTRKQLEKLGFEILEVENVTPGVIKAMEMDADRRREMVERLTPRLFRDVAANWAGLPGSEPHERFVSGTNRYMRCIARRKD